jgi:hypothetical protein
MNANEPTLPEESLFLQAIEIDSPDEQVAFLNRACGADAALRNVVEALLRHHREGAGFLETPPTEVVVAAEQLTIGEPERQLSIFSPLQMTRIRWADWDTTRFSKCWDTAASAWSSRPATRSSIASSR